MIRKIREAQEREEGFTLIELLVVVIIIGILAAIAIPVFLNQREKAFRSAVQADLRNMSTQLESHFVDNFTYLTYGGGTTEASVETALQGLASTGVTVTAADTTVTVNTYCIEATHTGLAGATSPEYSIRVNATSGAAKVQNANC